MRLQTLFVGHSIKVLERISSTNTFAMDLIRETTPAEGYVVWAKEQFAGRGQRGASWNSEPGANLTFSVILCPHFLPISKQFQLTKAIALGIAGFVSHILKDPMDVKIKWPNDIYVKNSKIAGILIENVLEQAVLKYAVIGIGLNVNQTIFDPALPNPVSLKGIAGEGFDTEDCLKQLCSFIEKNYLNLRSGNHAQLDESYRNLLYKRGIPSAFRLNGESMEAQIEGVNTAGHLVLKKKGSQEIIEVADSKQLAFL